MSGSIPPDPRDASPLGGHPQPVRPPSTSPNGAASLSGASWAQPPARPAQQQPPAPPQTAPQAAPQRPAPNAGAAPHRWSLDEATTYARDILTGEHISLRRPSPSDIEQLSRWWAVPELAILNTEKVLAPSDTALREQFTTWSGNNDAGAFFAVYARAEHALLGSASLFAVDGRVRSAMLGIALATTVPGAGYGTDAVRTLVRYGFEEMNLHRIELRVHAYNQRAIRVYEKVGFRPDGRRRDAIFHGGQYHDELIYSLLAPEYRR